MHVIYLQGAETACAAPSKCSPGMMFKSSMMIGSLLLALMLPHLSELYPHMLEMSENNAKANMNSEITKYQDIATNIIGYLTKGPGKHQVYNRLAKFVDTFGSRIAGSKNLENAIDSLLDELKSDGLENVAGEEVSVIHWVRGEESLQMISPRNYSMALLGLGGSVSTEPDGITAEVLVVDSFDDLENKSSLVRRM